MVQFAIKYFCIYTSFLIVLEEAYPFFIWLYFACYGTYVLSNLFSYCMRIVLIFILYCFIIWAFFIVFQSWSLFLERYFFRLCILFIIFYFHLGVWALVEKFLSLYISASASLEIITAVEYFSSFSSSISNVTFRMVSSTSKALVS